MNIVYARYNRHRLPPFQIETSIVEVNGAKTVIKKALTSEAVNHIQAIRSGYDLIQSSLNAGSLVLPRQAAFDASSISFEYIDGKSLDHLLFQSFRKKDKITFFKIIDDYCALLKKSFRLAERPEISAKISKIFGITASEQLGNGNGWLPLAAIDAVFENIIVSGDKHYLIDNEWVFAGALPFDFIVFRSLFYFHKVKYFEIGIEQWIRFEELLERCQINLGSAKRYQEMDESFQAYVYGPERCYQYKENYKKRQIAVHALEQTIDHQREVVRKYHGAIVTMRETLAEKERLIREKDRIINEMDRLIREKDRSINEMDRLIREKDRIINEMDRLIREKDRIINEMDRLIREKDRIINEIVNSFGWRLWRKIAGVLDYVCPAGSYRRRMTDRFISFLKSR